MARLAAQAGQAALVEDRADHPEVLVDHQLLAVADRHPGRLLAAMLEREQAQGGDGGGLRSREPAGTTAPKTPHIVSPPPGRAAGRASQACAQVGDRLTSRASATRAPRSSASPIAPRPPSSMTQPVAADRPDLGAARHVLAGDQQQRRHVPGDGRERPAATGLSPKSSTAGVLLIRQAHPRPAPAPDRALGEGHGQAAAGHVLGRRERGPRSIAAAHEPLDRRLAGQVQAGGPSSGATPARRRVGAPGEARGGLADEHDRIVIGHELRADQPVDVVEQADHADLRRSGRSRPAGDSL